MTTHHPAKSSADLVVFSLLSQVCLQRLCTIITYHREPLLRPGPLEIWRPNTRTLSNPTAGVLTLCYKLLPQSFNIRPLSLLRSHSQLNSNSICDRGAASEIGASSGKRSWLSVDDKKTELKEPKSWKNPSLGNQHAPSKMWLHAGTWVCSIEISKIFDF